MTPAGLDMHAPVAGDAARPSATHQHIFTLIRTLIAEGRVTPRGDTLRILDIGCGDGRMIHSLQTLADRHLASSRLEIHGFDIGEHGFSDDSQMGRTLAYLSERHPAIDWSKRIHMISEGDDWGYPAGSFDIAVSNQVIEHVEDLDHFLDNLRFAVTPGGPSIHVFPLGQCMQEAHCHVPFSHWIRDFNYRVAWIAMMSRLGIGRYRLDRTLLGHGSVSRHAVETAKFIECWTTYRSFREIADAASRRGMATSYQFTKDLFSTKLRQLAKRPAAARYRRLMPFGLEWLGFVVGRSLSSSTLTITPLQYDIGARIAAEKARRDRIEDQSWSAAAE
ncbi:class I SAM-dependent methyltransferase [Sphingomonas koreensis]|nr:class I SAM-dependent methyltransferase [Sphingomonas koreensis]